MKAFSPTTRECFLIISNVLEQKLFSDHTEHFSKNGQNANAT